MKGEEEEKEEEEEERSYGVMAHIKTSPCSSKVEAEHSALHWFSLRHQ